MGSLDKQGSQMSPLLRTVVGALQVLIERPSSRRGRGRSRLQPRGCVNRSSSNIQELAWLAAAFFGTPTTTILWASVEASHSQIHRSTLSHHTRHGTLSIL
ncbi:hypothetical protein BCV70DRAFT_68057 [Testicularia cyperi]|uniref:Uncharacterized protein n=1 Tax=Testicularia cyperi TaxID=1882483 RepID=A0A317XJ44_9BASI|nr:hypothetical protein BCV70DRAFT_68057 [Testicularia cyperi]